MLSRIPERRRHAVVIDESGQDAFVSAGADATGAFGLLVAVAADSTVAPPCDGLVVLAAAVAGDRPADGVLCFAWPTHRPQA